MKKIFLFICFIAITYVLRAQNIGINTSTPEAKLQIKGSEDTSQLVIDANIVQNNLRPLIKLRNSSGVDLMWLHSDHPTNSFLGLNAGRVNNSTNAPNGMYNTFSGSGAGYSNTTGYQNTANGYQALFLNSSGHVNTALGNGTLYSNTTGHFNTAIGAGALGSNTSVSYNTAIGYAALAANTVGIDNTANGAFALSSNTTGNENTAIGYQALNTQSYNPGGGNWLSGNVAVGTRALFSNQPTSILNGIYNTAVGSSALRNNTTGAYNTANGYQALYSNIIGYYNTANGYQALYSNITGYFNTANGYKALYSNTADYNTAIGYNALSANNTGTENTATGYNALSANTTGFSNTAIGNNALYRNTQGSDNTAFGKEALSINTVGAFNTGLGYNANVSANNFQSATAIGFSALVNSNNKVVIGENNSGMVIGGYANWSNLVSDSRFKENIQNNVPGLSFINRLHPVTYTIDLEKLDKNLTQYMPDSVAKRYFKSAAEYSHNKSFRHTGFIAQEVESVALELKYEFDGVNKPTNPTDNYSLSYASFVVPLVKAVQEQQQIIEDQKMIIDGQQTKIDLILKRLILLEEKAVK